MGSSLIGQLRILLGLETAQFETGSKKVRKDLELIKKSAEGVTMALETIGISLGIAAFTEAAKSALEYASSLADTSKQMGVTVEQTQILKRAAIENGVEWDKLKVGVQKLQITLGEAKAGLPAAVAAFKNVGIGQDQLKSLHDAGEALPHVMEGLKNVGDTATQAAAAKRLFGKSVADSLPLLVQGKEGYDEMSKAAEKAGLLTTEQAEKAHEAQVAIENLALALKTQLAGALADNADELTRMINKLGQLIAKIQDAFAFMGRLRTGLAEFSLQGNSLLTKGAIGAGIIPGPVGNAHIADNDRQLRWLRDEQMTQDLARKMGPVSRMFPERGGGDAPPNTLDLKPHEHHRKGHDHTEEREKEAEKLKYDLDKEELDAKRQTLDAQRALTVDTEDRNSLADQALQVEHDQRALEIQHNLTMVRLDRTISAAKKDEAEKSAARQVALNDNLLLLRLQGAALEAELARESEFDKTEAAMFDAQRSRLDAEQKLAKTAAERRKIELELLDLSYKEKSEALKRVIDTQYMGQYTHNYDDRNRARIELDALNRNYGSARTDVMRSTAGPLEELRNSIPQTAAEMNEALQSIEAQGLSSLRDGLAETSASWIKMGGVAGDTIRSVYTSLMKLVLSRGFSALLGMFGGGGTPGQIFSPAGGVPISLPSIPKLAGGGSMRLGGMAGIDTNLLSLNGTPLAKVSSGEHLDISPNGGRRGGLVFDLRGAVMTEDLLRQMQSMANAAQANGALGGMAGMTRQLGRAGRRRLG